MTEKRLSGDEKGVILHGTDGTPESNWFPWLKQEFEGQGRVAWVPLAE
ncbi:MAG TPA: hypothetical protein VF261_01550 [Candidatus Saccharimonadales bacterium]